MRGSTVRYTRPAPIRQGSQTQAQAVDRREAKRLNKYGAGSGGINMSSGRKTVGVAIRSSVFSFGQDTDELSGKDFTERNWKDKEQLKKKHLSQTEKRISRARNMKRSDSNMKRQYYMGSKTGRNLTAKEESIENNVRYVEQGRPQPSFSSGKENEDTGRTPKYRQRRTPPVQRRRPDIDYKQQQRNRRMINDEKRRTPQKKTKETSVGPSEYYTSPLKQKQDEATKALKQYEKTLAKVDRQVQEYQQQQQQQQQEYEQYDDNDDDYNNNDNGTSYETTKALEKHRRNLERAHNMQRTPGMAPTTQKNKKYQGKSLKERDPYLALLLGKLEDDIEAVENPVERTVSSQANNDRLRKLEEIEQRYLQRSEYNESVLPESLYEKKQRKMKKQNSKPRLTLVERQRMEKKRKQKLNEEAEMRRTKPAKDIIKERKMREHRKRVESNCLRLCRALKSNVVEVQLCIWDWQKTRGQKFKSKEVQRNKRLMLRKDLAKKLSNHRRCIVNLVESIKDWQKVNKTKQSFMFDGEDVYKLIIKMPLLPIAEHGQDRTLENDFSLAPLGNDDGIKNWLGFEPGTIVRRDDDLIDTNPFLLPPFDLKRLAVLTGDQNDMLVAQTVQIESDEEENDDEDVFPYSCAEEMPLVCFICNVGSRDSNGACANCGHVGGDNWQERDAQARQERFEEELEYFEEDKEERRRMKERKKINAKKNKVVYDSQIGDEVLLKFNEINKLLMEYSAQGSATYQQQEEQRQEQEEEYDEQQQQQEDEDEVFQEEIMDDKEQLMDEVDQEEEEQYEESATFIENKVEDQEIQTNNMKYDDDESKNNNMEDEEEVLGNNGDTFAIDEASGKINVVNSNKDDELYNDDLLYGNDEDIQQQEENQNEDLEEAEQMMKEINFESKMNDDVDNDENDQVVMGENDDFVDENNDVVNPGLDAYESKMMDSEEIVETDEIISEGKVQDNIEENQDTVENEVNDDMDFQKDGNEDDDIEIVENDQQKVDQVVNDMVEEEKEQQGEDEEKEESEPGSPQYDDTQRKTTQLVPEEMKVNKVPEKNEVDEKIVDDEDGAEKINEEQVEGEGKEEVQVEEVARPLSREDIRNARLAALEKRMAANTEENKEEEEEVVGDDSDSKK